MQWKCIILCLLISSNVLAKGNKKVKVLNDVTDNAVTSFSYEQNIYNGTVYENITAIHTTASDWNIGVSSMNIPVIGGGAQNYENDTYLIVTKSVEAIEDTLTFTIGSQNGYNLPKPTELHSFEYFDTQVSVDELFDIEPDLDIHFGPYYVNKSLATIDQTYGMQCGLEYKLNKFSFQADYFTGHNNLSGATINAFYNHNEKISLYGGVLVPETNSGNYYAGVVGVVYHLK